MKQAIVFLLLISSALAQANTAPQLTLAEAIRQGLNFSLEVQKAQSQRREADADYRAARSEILPNVDLNASAGGIETAEGYGDSFAHAYKARIDAEQPLFAGGALANALKAAELNRRVAEQKWLAAKHAYTFKIIEAYYKAAQAQVLLSITKDNRAVLKNYWEITTRYAAIGRSKGIDRLQAEASYNLSESQVLEAESTLEAYRQDLIRLIGAETSVDLDPRLTLEPFPHAAADKLLVQALEQNPELRSLRLQVDSLIFENRARMKEYRPSLALRGSYGYDSPQFDSWFKEKAEAYSFGLVLKIPLFQGFGSVALNDQLLEKRIQLEKDLAIKQKDLQKTLATALATMQRDFQRLKLTQISAASARKAMDVAVRDYRNGLLSSTDVIGIQRTRFDADRQLTLAQYSYNQQILNLRRDLGVDLQQSYERR